MYKYLIEIKKQKLKEEKEEYDSIITQQNDISKKLKDVQKHDRIKDTIILCTANEILLIVGLVGIIAITILINNGNIIKTEANTIINNLKTMTNTFLSVLFGAGSISAIKNFKDIKIKKQQLQEIKMPKESKDELEQKDLELKKQLGNIKESITKTLEQLEFLQELEKHPIVLADSQEKFLKMTETVEKGNLIFADMQNERIDYKNIELKPNGIEQDIHRNCGKKLVKVYK